MSSSVAPAVDKVGPYSRKGDSARVAKLVRMLGVGRNDARARSQLLLALEAIRGAVGASEKKKPQAARNANLEAVATAARALRIAYSKLDRPTRAALFKASWRGAPRPQQFEMEGSDDGAMDPQHDTLSRLIGEDRLDPRIMENFFRDLEDFATNAKGKSRGGPSTDQGAYEAVRLLATLFERLSGSKPSATIDGPFHRFVQAAFSEAGTDRDLIRAVRYEVRMRAR